MNVLTIVGRATKDPQVKRTPTGTHCFLTLAVNSRKDREADYFNVALHDKLAENCEKYVHKGDLVSVSGEVHLNRWGAQKQYSALGVEGKQLVFYGKRGANAAEEAADETETEEQPSSAFFSEVDDDEDEPFF